MTRRARARRAGVRLTLVIAVVTLLMTTGGTAEAQTIAEPAPAPSRVTFSGEASAVFSRRDDIAFFNFTDYEHNALRVARLRLISEWRASPRLSIIGEVRTEDADGVEVAALYARWRPWADRALTVQLGRIPPVVGAFARRAYGSSNVVLGFPLAYQYLVSLRPDAIPASVDDLLRMRGRGWQPSFPIGSEATRAGLPMVSAFRWDTGAQVSWRSTSVELAGAVVRGAPSRPVVRGDPTRPGWSGRVAFHLPTGTIVGVSGARGQWIEPAPLRLVTNDGRPSSSQSVVGVDAEHGRGPWMVRGEWIRSVFALPLVADAGRPISLDAWSGFVEARYKLTARWSLAGRVERLQFGTVAAGPGGAPTPWDAGVDRVEVAASFRVTRSADVKAGWQHNWRDGGRVRARGFPAVGLVYGF